MFFMSVPSRWWRPLATDVGRTSRQRLQAIAQDLRRRVDLPRKQACEPKQQARMRWLLPVVGMNGMKSQALSSCRRDQAIQSSLIEIAKPPDDMHAESRIDNLDSSSGVALQASG